MHRYFSVGEAFGSGTDPPFSPLVMTLIRSRLRVAASVASLACIALAPRVAAAQVVQPLQAVGALCAVKGSADQAPAASAAVYRLTSECLGELRSALNAGAFGRALEIYFGDSYNPALANWVVYVRADGSVKQGVIQKGVVTDLLRGQKYIYTSAFFEAVPTNPADSISPALELSRRSVNFQKEQFTTVLVNAFGAGKIPAFDAGATVMDLDRQMSLRLVSDDPRSPLWAGSARVEIGENTDVQLALAANGRQRLPGTLTRLYTTLNNAKATRWDLGLGIATAFGSGSTTVDGSGTEHVSSSFKANVYLTSYLNILPARLPRLRHSWSLVGGTNIANGALLDDLLTGVAVGRVVGDAGIMMGVLWESRKRESVDPITHANRTQDYRQPRFFIGFDLRA